MYTGLTWLVFDSTRDPNQSMDNGPVYTFDMAALSDHLRSQGETNKTASYFNIDILKYQVLPPTST